jgi:hypothetical protein
MLAANLVLPNAVIAPILGRNLSTGANGNITVNLIEPGTLYGDRVNELDLRVAKIVRLGRTRTNVGFDIYNLLNANPAVTCNAAYSAAFSFPRPQSVLTPRLAKFSVQVDFQLLQPAANSHVRTSRSGARTWPAVRRHCAPTP